MRKQIIKIVTAAILLSSLLNIGVNANSGPVKVESNGVYDVFTPEKSQISVTGEELIFDFSEESSDPYVQTGNCLAVYKMKNAQGVSVKQEMIFPIITNLKRFCEIAKGYSEVAGVKIGAENKIEIKDGDRTLPYEIILGKRISDKNSDLSFEEILNSAQKPKYEFKNISIGKAVYTYTYEVNREGIDDVYAEISGRKNPGEVFISEDFNSSSFDDGMFKFAAWLGKNEKVTLKLSVIGEYTMHPEAPKMYFYKDIDRKEELSVPVVSSVSEMQMADLPGKIVDEIIAQNPEFGKLIKRSALEYEVSEYLDNAGDYIQNGDFLNLFNRDFVIMLKYGLDFSPNEGKSVSISYPLSTSMEKLTGGVVRQTVKYYLNPAKNWASFGNFKLDVICSEKYPFIIDSNLKLKKEGNIYTYENDTLPDSDLEFSMSNRKRVVSLWVMPAVFIGMFIVFGLTFFIIRKHIRRALRRRKRRASKNEV